MTQKYIKNEIIFYLLIFTI